MKNPKAISLPFGLFGQGILVQSTDLCRDDPQTINAMMTDYSKKAIVFSSIP
jgi:hypothetical protein